MILRFFPTQTYEFMLCFEHIGNFLMLVELELLIDSSCFLWSLFPSAISGASSLQRLNLRSTVGV